MLTIIDRSDLAECSGKYRIPGDRRKTHPTRIVVHRNTASKMWSERHPGKFSSDIEALHDFHANSPWKFRLFPYHYFIDRDGSVYRVHDEMMVSPHAPNRGNWRSIGIALNFDGRNEKLNDEAESSLILLSRDILKRWPSCDMMGHSKTKRCPGPLIDIASIEKKVRGFDTVANSPPLADT